MLTERGRKGLGVEINKSACDDLADLSSIGTVEAGFLMGAIYSNRILLERLLSTVPEFKLSRTASGERGEKGLNGN